MMTPPSGGTLIQLRGSILPLLNWHNLDRWSIIGEKRKRQKVAAKKTATIKVHLQIKKSEAFYRCIKSMNSLYSSTTDEEKLIIIIQQSSNTIKDSFVHIGGKLAELPNQKRELSVSIFFGSSM